MVFTKGHKINVGRKHSEETKEKIGNAHQGRVYSKETVEKMRDSKLGNKNPMFGRNHTELAKSKTRMAKLDEKNPMWKGDDVGVSTLHEWVRRRKPKPKFCVNCKKNPPCDLANTSGKYKRDVNDFKWLCRSCHRKQDRESYLKSKNVGGKK